jgi:carbonic anhydrase
MSTTEDLLANNHAFASDRALVGAPEPRATMIAVLTCMDARIDPVAALGLLEGDAHVIRNAGGIATDDAIRSLLISQRLLDTSEVMVVQHTDCGMTRFDEGELRAELERETGTPPPFELGSFSDLDASVSATVARLRESPMLTVSAVRGFVYDVVTGALREVTTGR